jgi:molybdopterin/thiamine biosynthesis adenylyltransferase
VDLTNLQRQIAHNLARVGQPKVGSAAQAIAAINPDVQVVGLQERADASGSTRWCRSRRGARLQRQLQHPPCRQRRLRGAPQAAGVGRGDRLRRADLGLRHAQRNEALLRLHLSRPKPTFEEVRCATMGVFAPLVGIIGTMQAAEALKLLAGVGSRWPAGCRCSTRARWSGPRSASRGHRRARSAPRCVRAHSARRGLQSAEIFAAAITLDQRSTSLFR